jgi:2-dehydro-3-deoxy-D-arabinonate dehydratase
MYLTKHRTPTDARWAVDGIFLKPGFQVGSLLERPAAAMSSFLAPLSTGEPATGDLLAPIDADQEVWACGVTYLRSREAREAESTVKDVYSRVYEARRPELFFKGIGWRTVGHLAPVRVREDSNWNVPEPELTLVANAAGEIVGYTVGDDVSSRDIEGTNPLYLTQAKVYDGSCAIGPGLLLQDPAGLSDLSIAITIMRDDSPAFHGAVSTSQIRRSLDDLVGFLYRELSFPRGSFLMTGTGIVPPPAFSLAGGDVIQITIGELTLENPVALRSA